MSQRKTASQRVHERLDHPVIDADGHYFEYMPALDGYLREQGLGGGLADAMASGSGFGAPGWSQMAPEDRLARRAARQPWWPLPMENTLDIATATFPALMRERLDEFGIDFSITYPTAALAFAHIADDDVRRAACRGLNAYLADAFRDLGDRLTPAAVIPMHTPDEAVAGLEHACGELGLKAVALGSFADRPIPAAAEREASGETLARWHDFFGLESAYDYDPVWSKCLELGVSPATHSGSMGWGSRRSIDNYMFNHIGHFAVVGEAACRSLFFGGVTQRFPGLRIAFLEGGVHWAVALLCDLIARFEKRGINSVERYNPRRLDKDLFDELAAKYGRELVAGPARPADLFDAMATPPHDDFEHTGVHSRADILERFLPNFYFGCEADDPMTATAFDSRRTPDGCRLAAMFSSDVGHWDVPDMTEVLEEAYESVERGWLTEADFRDFTFSNAARFYTDTNPDFFAGTAVESEVAAGVL